MTPDEIALKIVSKWNDNELPMSLEAAIAAAIRAERERAERLKDQWPDDAHLKISTALADLSKVVAERDRLRDALEEVVRWDHERK